MATKTVVVSLLLLMLMSRSISNADEPQTTNEPTVKELLARIEKLEKRIQELEAGSQPESQDVTSGPKGIQSSINEALEAYRRYKGATPRASSSMDSRSPSTHSLPIAATEVPSSWHRHEFNGHYYYTIPLSSSVVRSRKD